MMAWVKAFHVIAVIAWMAGSLYLPRLFVYHASAGAGSEAAETLKVMEWRLLWMITTPAMVAAWGFGLWLVLGFGVIDWSEPWVWIKAIAVVALSVYHSWMVSQVKAFAADRNTRTARYFRIANEIPTVLMVIIVIMVIVRPF